GKDHIPVTSTVYPNTPCPTVRAAHVSDDGLPLLCRCTTAVRSIFSLSGVWQEAKIKRAALSPVIKFPLIYIYLYLAIYFSFFESVAAIRPTSTSLVSATSCNDFNFLEPSSGRSRIVAAPPSTARVVYPLISLYFSFLPPRYNSPVFSATR